MSLLQGLKNKSGNTPPQTNSTLIPTINIVKGLTERQVTDALYGLRIIFDDNTAEGREDADERGRDPVYIARCIGYFSAYGTNVKVQALETLCSIIEASRYSVRYLEDYVTPEFMSEVIEFSTSSSEGTRTVSCAFLRAVLSNSLSFFGPRIFDNESFLSGVMSNLKRYNDAYTLDCCARFVLYYGLIRSLDVDSTYITKYVLPTITALVKDSRKGFANSVIDLAELCIEIALNEDDLSMSEVPLALIRAGVPAVALSAISTLPTRLASIALIFVTCFVADGKAIVASISTEELLSQIAPLLASPECIQHLEALLSILVAVIRNHNKRAREVSSAQISKSAKVASKADRLGDVDSKLPTKSSTLERPATVQELPVYLAFVLVDILRNAKVTSVVQAALDIFLHYLSETNPWHVRTLLSMGFVPALVRLFSNPVPTIHVGAIIALRNCVSVCAQQDETILASIQVQKAHHTSQTPGIKRPAPSSSTDISSFSSTLASPEVQKLRSARAFCADVTDELISVLSFCGGYDLLNHLYVSNESGQALAAGRALSRLIEQRLRETLPPLSDIPKKDAPDGVTLDLRPEVVSKILAHVQRIPDSLQLTTVLRQVKSVEGASGVYSSTLREFNRAKVLFALQQLNKLASVSPFATEKALVRSGEIHRLLSIYACGDVMLRAQACVLLTKILLNARNSSAPIPPEVLEKVTAANTNNINVNDAASGKTLMNTLKNQPTETDLTSPTLSLTVKKHIVKSEKKSKPRVTVRRATIDWTNICHILTSIAADALKDRRAGIDKLSAVLLLELFRWLRARAAKFGRSPSYVAHAVPRSVLAILERPEVLSLIQDRSMTKEEQEEEIKYLKTVQETYRQLHRDANDEEAGEEESFDESNQAVDPEKMTDQSLFAPSENVNAPKLRKREEPVDESTREIFKQLHLCLVYTRKMLSLDDDQ